MIDPRKLSTIRKRVMKSRLEPLGFELVKSQWVSSRNAQLLFVSFEPEKYGNGFDVQVGLHLDYLPPFAFQAWPGAAVPSGMRREVCAFQRLVRTRQGQQYYEYGETEAEAEEMLSDIADRIVMVFDTIGKTVGDGKPLLESIRPDLLANDLQTFKTIFSANSVAEQAIISDSMRIRQLFPDWFPHITPMAILMAYIARHFSEDALAKQYLDVAKASGLEKKHLPYWETLSHA